MKYLFNNNRMLRSYLVLGMAALLAPLIFSLSGCESKRPGTVNTFRERLQEADQPSILRNVNWQAWPRVVLAHSEDITVGVPNWRGPRDASAEIGIEIYGDRLTIAGQILDDRPLQQPVDEPRRPLYWGMPYAADAVEVRFVPVDSRNTPVTVLVSFGTEGTDPHLSVIESADQAPGRLGAVEEAYVGWQKTPLGVEFIARAVRMDDYGLRALWQTAYRMEVTLYDYDAFPDNYTVLRNYVVTRQQRID